MEVIKVEGISVVIAPYKSNKYSVEEALKRSGIDFDEIVYVYGNWLEKSFEEMISDAEKRVNDIEAREVYVVGAGYIPCVLAIWDSVKKRRDDFEKITLLDFDTAKGIYRKRRVK